MVDPFETLGIAPVFDVDLGGVEKRHRELSRVLHPDRYVGASPAERRMALSKAVEVNEAWRIVRDPVRRADALLRRRGVLVAEGQEPKADPAFLMEVMELREALAAARAKRDAARVAKLADEVRQMEAATTRALAEGFAGEATDAPPLVALVGKLRYFRRFLDEVSLVEDDLAGLPPPGANV